ncbi:hypothetical protein Vretifemale_4098, partial [Volvox reticuliferus]
MALAQQSPNQPYSSNPKSLKTLQPKFADELLARTDTLISRIRPTGLSLQRRWIITDHVTAIVRRCFAPHDVTAIPFGSVPLKTYLPDGDIDLSIYSESPRAQALKEALRDTWATQLQLCLEEEANNPTAVFRVANVQVIHAEVKLLKCLVDNIVVDISFFQVGGLNTYNFLEDVDRFVDQCIPVRKHLFKDSIILVKGWCYYESRVLGAHHGLISTYALETLVLYVINLYHRELVNPLQVLYKFLVECSGFDWENYCLSLEGPIPLSTFPRPVVETPEALQRDALLTKDFMARAYLKYTEPQLKAQGGEPKQFAIKQLNVMDPILPGNNLGRSVSKASYLRIRRAFEHGARMLAEIADQAKELGPFIGAKRFDNFFGKVWNAQRPRNRPPAVAGEHGNGMHMGAPPGLHHPVALRPLPQPFSNVPAPPPPSTSAPPIAGSSPASVSGGGPSVAAVYGCGSGGPSGTGSDGGASRNGMPQLAYDNMAGDLHMLRRQEQGQGPRPSGPAGSGMMAPGTQWIIGGGQEAGATGQEGATIASVAPAAGAAVPDAESFLRNPNALYILSQIASNLQGAGGGAAATCGAALPSTMPQASESLWAAAMAAAANPSIDPQIRQRLLVLAQSLPLISLQQAQASSGSTTVAGIPWELHAAVGLQGPLAAGTASAAQTAVADATGEGTKIPRVMSAPVIPAGSSEQTASGKVKAVSNAVAAAATTAAAAGSAGGTHASAARSTGRAAAVTMDVEPVSIGPIGEDDKEAIGGEQSRRMGDGAGVPPTPLPTPLPDDSAALGTFGQGPSDTLEDDAAASEGLVASPDALVRVGLADKSSSEVEDIDEGDEDVVAESPSKRKSEAGSRPVSRNTSSACIAQPPSAGASAAALPYRAQPSVAAMLVPAVAAAVPSAVPVQTSESSGGNAAISSSGEDVSPRQLPYAVPVMPEELQQKLMSRSPSSGPATSTSTAAPAAPSAGPLGRGITGGASSLPQQLIGSGAQHGS